MEITWLEDFLCLADLGSFTRAAERRNVTQPAFSRRIRALESWINADLFDRDARPVLLTPAGRSFQPVAEEALRRLYSGREKAKSEAHAAAGMLRFAATHALSTAYFPSWLRSIEAELGRASLVQLTIGHSNACERLMLQGQVQFVLRTYNSGVTSLLAPQQFDSIVLMPDRMVPVSAPETAGSARPLFALPGSPDAPLPHLSYNAESGMGQIMELTRSRWPETWLRPAFISQSAYVLISMARDGRGVGWAPHRLVAEDLAAGILVRSGAERWDVPVEIRLFRPRARQSRAAEEFWSAVKRCALGSG